MVNAKVECEYKLTDKQKLNIVFNNDSVKAYTDQGKDKTYIDYEVDVLFDLQGKCPQTIYQDFKEGYDRMVLVESPITGPSDKIELIDARTNKVYCGSEEQGRITGIPKKVPELTSAAVTIIQVAIPIILVMLGTLDLFKGITAGKEDEIKKGQQLFIKRLAVAAVVFLIVIIVKFFISVIADTNQTNIIDCIDCFIDNDCEEDFSV